MNVSNYCTRPGGDVYHLMVGAERRTMHGTTFQRACHLRGSICAESMRARPTATVRGKLLDMQGFVPMRKWSALLVLFGIRLPADCRSPLQGSRKAMCPAGYGYNRPYYGYGGFGYGGYGAGSTPMGSYMAGMSQVILAGAGAIQSAELRGRHQS